MIFVHLKFDVLLNDVTYPLRCLFVVTASAPSLLSVIKNNGENSFIFRVSTKNELTESSDLRIQRLERRIISGNQEIGYDGVREITLCDNQFANRRRIYCFIRVKVYYSFFDSVVVLYLYSMYIMCAHKYREFV